ncbi:MAG: hypothetical protein WBP85_06630, partial [Terracidiphilus sp.]
ASIDPGKLTREVASRYANSLAVARRLVDIASARLWLAEGVPLADVLTMLEVRHRFELSSTDCRGYAIEILWAAELEIVSSTRGPNSTPKEPPYAVA